MNNWKTVGCEGQAMVVNKKQLRALKAGFH